MVIMYVTATGKKQTAAELVPRRRTI